jgi:hydroxyacylglutathione hydrolase
MLAPLAGGTSARGQMIIETRAVGPFFKNGYLVACERTHDAVLIDPGDEVDQLIALVGQLGLSVKAIPLTHAHVDHVSGVAAAKRAFDVPIYLHRDDRLIYERAPEFGRLFGLEVEAPPPVDRYYAPGTLIRFGDYEIRAHHTPGHCPGGVCLAIARSGEAAKDLFVGDTLFAGSIGRTDLPGGDYDVLMESITGVLFPLGDDRIVHPGHGPDTTIQRERTTNDFVLEYFAAKR